MPFYGILRHKAIQASFLFLSKAILYHFLPFTLNSLGIVYEFLLYFYVGQCSFCPAQIGHEREQSTFCHFS
jgi:hypothetical protein